MVKTQFPFGGKKHWTFSSASVPLEFRNHGVLGEGRGERGPMELVDGCGETVLACD